MTTAILWLALLGDLDSHVEATRERETLLYVATRPAGAEVLVDGKRVGITDGLFPIEPGVRSVIVELDGHDRQRKQVTIREGDIQRLKLKLIRRTKQEVSEKADSPKSTAAESTRVFLPDQDNLQINPKPKVVLDLATGELHPVKEGKAGEYLSFAQNSKDNRVYHRKLRSLPGAQTRRIDGTLVIGRGADEYQNTVGAGHGPYCLVIATPDGEFVIEYRPAVPAVRSRDHRSSRPDVGKQPHK